jgi:hypothetical protein
VKLRTISLLRNTGSERETKERLLGLFEKYPRLVDWTFKDELMIRDDGNSHSYPELTLATGQLLERGDAEFLSVFVHENIHCFLSGQRNLAAAKAELRVLYPKVPVGRINGVHLGARDEDSTYLHLVVGYLECLAMSELLGEQQAFGVLQNHDFYKWIYQTVLVDKNSIGKIIEKNGLIPNSN